MGLGVGADGGFNRLERGGELVGRHAVDGLFKERLKSSRVHGARLDAAGHYHAIAVGHDKPLLAGVAQLEVGDFEFLRAVAGIRCA